MRVKLRCTIATATMRAQVGQVVDLDDDWATSLIQNNQADPVAGIEEAVVSPPESAMRKRKRQSHADEG